MRKLFALGLLVTLAAGSQVSRADDSSATQQYANVRIVGASEYFNAKQNQLPISEADTLDLIKQDGHGLQLDLERWSVDNPPPGSHEVTFYPTGDQLDSELNTWHKSYGSYTGKRSPAQGAGFYTNPVTSTTLMDYTGVSLPLGWTTAAPGNFTYLYQVDAQGRGIHYMLLLYGTQASQGFDVTGDGVADGVILQLTDGTRDKQVPDQPWYCNGVVVNGVTVAEQG